MTLLFAPVRTDSHPKLDGVVLYPMDGIRQDTREVLPAVLEIRYSRFVDGIAEGDHLYDGALAEAQARAQVEYGILESEWRELTAEEVQMAARGFEPLPPEYHKRQRDLEFFNALGEERVGVTCRTEGCSRGAIAQSLFCRAHHFEMVKNEPYPF